MPKLDPNVLASTTVDVKMPDGTTVEKPVAEVVAGFMMAADYTLKTQNLSADRAKLDQEAQQVAAFKAAIGKDPVGMGLKIAASQFGIDPDTPGLEQKVMGLLSEKLGMTYTGQKDSSDGDEEQTVGAATEDSAAVLELRQAIAKLEQAVGQQGASYALHNDLARLSALPDFDDNKDRILALAAESKMSPENAYYALRGRGDIGGAPEQKPLTLEELIGVEQDTADIMAVMGSDLSGAPTQDTGRLGDIVEVIGEALNSG